MTTTSQTQYGPVYDILIVDNKELTRDTVQKILQQEGYTVDTARHGKEAIEKVRSNNYGYRLVITELIMPYAGGFEVIKTIKKESRIPVMVLSAVADEDTINESFRLSADDFLKKPFMASELVQRIQRLLIRHAVPVYPKTVIMPVPAPVVPQVVEVDEDKAVEAVVAKRKRSIKAAASGQSKTVVVKKNSVAKKATAAKVTASKAEKVAATDTAPAAKTTAAKAKTTTARAKTTATKPQTAATKTKTVPTKTATVTKTVRSAAKKTAAPKKAVKKSESGRAKPIVKKAAGTGARKGKANAAAKSKLIIRNSVPMIRSIPMTESRLSLKGGGMRSGLCAIAV